MVGLMKNVDQEKNREQMLSNQIIRRGISDARVLDAMRSVPREEFVVAGDENEAYQDRPLPIGHNQTISQPYIVAYMTEQIRIQPDDVVLDIGTGSGYQAAILSRLAKQVYTIEYVPELAKRTAKLFEHLHYENITVIEGDGSGGYPERAPYDAILMAAAAPGIPEPLVEQLAPGGRLILPVGGSGSQILKLITKNTQGQVNTENLISVVFVPLRGGLGWQDEEWRSL